MIALRRIRPLALENPWTAAHDVEPVGQGPTVRHFFGRTYVVNRLDGTIQIIDPGTFETLHTFSVGAASEPHDILVVAPDRAYVSRHASPLLYEVDPTTGALDPDAPGQGGFFDSLFVSHDTLVHDPLTHQLFFPDPTASPAPGIQVFDSSTDERLTRIAVATSKPPVDLVVARDMTPGEASAVRVTARDPATGALTLAYTPACGATNHNLVFGPLEAVSSYGYSGQVCAIGNGAPFPGFAPGPGSFFFLVVGTDGAAREGSYGRASSGAERPEVLDDPACPHDQDLGARCD